MWHACIFILNHKEIRSNKTKEFIFNFISLGWLCIFMFLHKEIERLKIDTYSRLPLFWLALVIDHHLRHHCHYHHLLHFYYHWNRQCHLASQVKIESRCSKSDISQHLLDYWELGLCSISKTRCCNEFEYERWPFGLTSRLHSNSS